MLTEENHSHRSVAVLGAGSWGTALASVLVENGHDVTIWARDASIVEEINQKHTHSRYLPGRRLSERLQATDSIREAVSHKEILVFAVPSQAMRSVCKQIMPWLANPKALVHVAKGFELESWKRMSEVMSEEIPAYQDRIVALSGPSHAEEVIQRCPTTVVVASKQKQVAEEVQNLFMAPHFRVYTNSDLIGIEIGGALKNIIALATGLCDGLGFGDNARAALMTRGLAEIARFGTTAGAKAMTFVGLAGMGDLVGTCTSQHSRNWKAGYLISQGKGIEVVLQEMGMVVEGIKTTRATHLMAQEMQVEMPITEQLYEVLFAGKKPSTAVEQLMRRGKTEELKDISLDWG